MLYSSGNWFTLELVRFYRSISALSLFHISLSLSVCLDTYVYAFRFIRMVWCPWAPTMHYRIHKRKENNTTSTNIQNMLFICFRPKWILCHEICYLYYFQCDSIDRYDELSKTEKNIYNIVCRNVRHRKVKYNFLVFICAGVAHSNVNRDQEKKMQTAHHTTCRLAPSMPIIYR